VARLDVVLERCDDNVAENKADEESERCGDGDAVESGDREGEEEAESVELTVGVGGGGLVSDAEGVEDCVREAHAEALGEALARALGEAAVEEEGFDAEAAPEVEMDASGEAVGTPLALLMPLPEGAPVPLCNADGEPEGSGECVSDAKPVAERIADADPQKVGASLDETLASGDEVVEAASLLLALPWVEAVSDAPTVAVAVPAAIEGENAPLAVPGEPEGVPERAPEKVALAVEDPLTEALWEGDRDCASEAAPEADGVPASDGVAPPLAEAAADGEGSDEPESEGGSVADSDAGGEGEGEAGALAEGALGEDKGDREGAPVAEGTLLLAAEDVGASLVLAHAEGASLVDGAPLAEEEATKLPVGVENGLIEGVASAEKLSVE